MTDTPQVNQPRQGKRSQRPSGRGGARGRRCGDEGSVIVEAAFVMPILVLLLFGVIEMGGVMLSYSGTSNAASAGARAASVAANDVLADRQILNRIGAEAAGIPNGEIQYVIIYNAYDPRGSNASSNAGLLAACQALATANSSNSGSYDGSQGVSDGGPTVDSKGACNVYSNPQQPLTAGSTVGGAFAKAALPLITDTTPPATNGPAYANWYFGCGSTNVLGHGLDCKWPGVDRQVTQSTTPGIGQLPTPDFVGVYVKTKHDYYTRFVANSMTITDQSIAHIEPQNYPSS